MIEQEVFATGISVGNDRQMSNRLVCEEEGTSKTPTWSQNCLSQHSRFTKQWLCFSRNRGNGESKGLADRCKIIPGEGGERKG